MPVQVSAELGQALLDAVVADPALQITVDVERLQISAPAAGLEGPFPLDAFTQHRILEGLDDVGITLRHADAIVAFEQDRPTWLPSATS